jgi:CHAT domain-containing protein
LILLVHKGKAKPIWLTINDKELRSILIEGKGSEKKGYLAGQLGRTPIRPVLDEVLPWIGERIAEPLSEALRSLNISQVVLVPIGRVALLPIHAAIYSKAGTEKTVLDEFTVSYAPSARAFYHSLQATKLAPSITYDLFAVGDPQPLATEIHPLPYAQFEIKEIAKLFSGNVKLLFEERATYSGVYDAIRDANHIHFACHATFEVEAPLDSGLLLSNKGRLTLSDLLSLEGLHRARLVVLSACQTAIVDFDKLPEESIGLAGGFLQAGVPGVVGSLWSIDDVSTTLLMVHFYQIYLSGISPEEALRQAQVWLRNARKIELLAYSSHFGENHLKLLSKRLSLEDNDERPFSHPYYWAGFTYHGV